MFREVQKVFFRDSVLIVLVQRRFHYLRYLSLLDDYVVSGDSCNLNLKLLAR